MKTLPDLIVFFNTAFKPAYADLVAYIADKPAQIIIEIENAFAHLMVYLDDKQDEQIRTANLQKAYNHIARATLDCYKLLWVRIDEDIVAILKDENKRKFVINMPEGELLQKWRAFKESAKKARKNEIDSIGKDTIDEVVQSYYETISIGWEIIKNIDPDKLNAYKKFSIAQFVRQQWIGLIVGVLSGIAATFIYNKLFLH